MIVEAIIILLYLLVAAGTYFLFSKFMKKEAPGNELGDWTWVALILVAVNMPGFLLQIANWLLWVLLLIL